MNDDNIKLHILSFIEPIVDYSFVLYDSKIKELERKRKKHYEIMIFQEKLFHLYGTYFYLNTFDRSNCNIETIKEIVNELFYINYQSLFKINDFMNKHLMFTFFKLLDDNDYTNYNTSYIIGSIGKSKFLF